MESTTTTLRATWLEADSLCIRLEVFPDDTAARGLTELAVVAEALSSPSRAQEPAAPAGVARLKMRQIAAARIEAGGADLAVIATADGFDVAAWCGSGPRR